MVLLRTSAALAVVAMAGTALGQVTKSSLGFLLRARYRSGEVRHYMMLTGTQGVNVKTQITLKVLSVKKGIATVQIYQAPPTGGPKDVPLGFARTNTLKFDKENRAVGSSTNASIVALFPIKPVKKGEVWGGTSTFSLGANAGGALESAYQFSGIRRDRGKQLAVLDVQMRGFATGNGNMLIDCADGSLLASSMTIKIHTGPNESYPVQLAIRRVGG